MFFFNGVKVLIHVFLASHHGLFGKTKRSNESFTIFRKFTLKIYVTQIAPNVRNIFFFLTFPPLELGGHFSIFLVHHGRSIGSRMYHLGWFHPRLTATDRFLYGFAWRRFVKDCEEVYKTSGKRILRRGCEVEVGNKEIFELKMHW